MPKTKSSSPGVIVSAPAQSKAGLGPALSGRRAAQRRQNERQDGDGRAHDERRPPAEDRRGTAEYHAEHEAGGAGGGEDTERLCPCGSLAEDGEKQR